MLESECRVGDFYRAMSIVYSRATLQRRRPRGGIISVIRTVAADWICTSVETAPADCVNHFIQCLAQSQQILAQQAMTGQGDCDCILSVAKSYCKTSLEDDGINPKQGLVTYSDGSPMCTGTNRGWLSNAGKEDAQNQREQSARRLHW